MVVWGAIWGAVLGFYAGRHDAGFGLVIGALLGALAGRTLRTEIRKEVRQEIHREIAAKQAAAVAEPHASASPSTNYVEPVPGPAAVQPAAPPVQVPFAGPDLANTATTADQSGALPGESTHGIADIAAAAAPGQLATVLSQARSWLIGGNTVVRMGILVLFVGLAFLAKYAVDNALLPAELRLAAIALAGISLFVFGWRLHAAQPERRGYALSLQGAGVGVLYLTVFVAFRLYQFLPTGAAFVVLGLVCLFSTAIALMQNALAMAFIGFAGAFAAPILVSTGQGDHVGLFSYYLLLGIAIASVAWLRAWRALNLLGFFASFGVATAWGVLQYRPDQLATTEPFLLAFFGLYLAASLMYSTRHGLEPKRAVDATLIFGNPIVAMGLQAALMRDVPYASALSSLALGGLYLGLGWWAMRRKDAGVGQWLAECFAALGLGFVTLAVPLALDGRWTAAIWSAEGAAVYWMGQRQGRWLARLAGLALQAIAGLGYVRGLGLAQEVEWPVVNPEFLGAALLAASAFAIGNWSRSSAESVNSTWARQCVLLEQKLSPVLFWAGFLWWQWGLVQEIERGWRAADGHWVPLFGSGLQTYLEMLGWLGSAWAVHSLALPARAKPWPIAATPAWFSLPVMVTVALYGILEMRHVFQSWGWGVWPLALVLHGVTLRRLDTMAPQRLWSWAHSAGVWLIVLLVGNLLVWSVQQAHLRGTAWSSVIYLVASVAVLLSLTPRMLYQANSNLRRRWPLDRFALAYLWRAAVPLALGVAVGTLAVSVHSDGNARPLPYLPLLNPTDMTLALALAACALWLARIRQCDLVRSSGIHHRRWTLALAGVAFIAINTVWLRIAHQLGGVRWHAERLYASFLVQAGYSILWTLLAMGLMVFGYRRDARAVWMGGATLMGLTVVKLFLVDLSNRGGSERIVAFIAVGVLMLVVGYFAPIPPTAAPDGRISEEQST